MATFAASSAFRRVWSDPAGMVTRQQYTAQTAVYDYRWHLYRNSVFDDVRVWAEYRRKYGLYRYIRPIYNPVTRLVDFYVGIVYPGVLAIDGKRLPDGTPLAIPLASDIDPALANAIGQMWQWSNWQTQKNLFVRYGAALGDVMVEVVDELDRGKVTFDVIWPGMVTDLELDGTGNVKSYTIEYDSEDEAGDTYTYKKVVDQDWISEFKDDEPYQYDEGIAASRANPYGFCPAIWCKHTDLGGNHGSPAVRNVNKIDDLNELASHAHDRAHAVLSSPILVAGKGVQNLNADVTEGKRVATNEMANPSGGRESVKILKADDGGMSTVQLPEGEALNYIAQMIAEIENDHPELNMYKELRGMSQVTGPGAERMIGDAAAYIQDARANYDQQTIKLMQMGIAIAGWRANTGAWGRTLTRQQKAFLPYDLDSYYQGELDFEIMPRPITGQAKLTPDEQRAAMEQSERGFATREKVIEILGGNPAEDMPLIDAEQEAKRVAEADMAAAAMEEAQRQFNQPANSQPPQNNGEA